jgi:hypothetical protein
MNVTAEHTFRIGFSYVALNQILWHLTAIGLTPGGSSTVQIYTQAIHETTQITIDQHK